MSVGLKYDLNQLQGAVDRINQLGQLDRKQLLDDIGSLNESQVRGRIKHQEGAPDGTPWEPWSARHLNTRHDNNEILFGKGDLLGSIQHEVGADSVVIGSNLIYARVQQEGSGNESVTVPAHKRRITQAFGRLLPFGVWASVGSYSFKQNIPARPYLGLSAQDEQEISQLINSFVTEALHA